VHGPDAEDKKCRLLMVEPLVKRLLIKQREKWEDKRLRIWVITIRMMQTFACPNIPQSSGRYIPEAT
jgi:hypothetical protein